MANVQPQRKSCLRALWRAFVFLFLLVFINALIFGAVAWNKRVVWVTRIVRGELDKRGLSEVSFEIDTLLPNRVVLRNIGFPEKQESFAVQCLDVRFSFPEILAGEVSRVRASGVKLDVAVDEGRMILPLVERLKALAEETKDTHADSAPLPFNVGTFSVHDVDVHFWNARKRIATLTVAEASAICASDEREAYQVSLTLKDKNDDARRMLHVNGEIVPDTGFMELYGDVQVSEWAPFVAVAHAMAPQDVAQVPVVMSNGTVTASVHVRVLAWMEVAFFRVAAELGRGSVLSVPGQDTEVTLQSLRVEASGVPRDIQGRMNMGIAGVRSGGDIQVSQEEGRLLSVRGAARFEASETNRTLRATLDSDLSGRVAARVLPDILPLMPRLLTDGGTFHAETVLEQVPGVLWQGGAHFLAEARRTSVTLPAGRFAAGRAAVGGRVDICDNRAGDVQVEVMVDDGMYSSQGNSTRANFSMVLDVPPPYQEARGTFEGRVNAGRWLESYGVRLAETNGVAFTGSAELAGITSVPEWVVALQVPDFGVMSVSNDWRSTVGGKARVFYSPSETAGGASLWAEGSRWASPDGGATAGVGRVAVALDVPAFRTAEASNAVAQVRVEVSDGCGGVGDVFAVEGLRSVVPFTWSAAEGVAFPSAPELAWGRMTVDGLGVEPTGFALANADGVLDMRAGVRCAGSALNIQAQALVPLVSPGQLTVGVEIPDMVLEPEDSLAGWVRKMDKESHITGNLAVRADLRLLGRQPYVLGRLDVTEGTLTRGGLDISGIRVSVPFEVGMTPRTIQRPFVAFEAMNVGDIRLENGRVYFQATPGQVFIDRMEADFCKGKLHAYSIHLDAQNPRTEVTVYADRIDLGEMLMVSSPLRAQRAEGVLFGRFPVAIDGGQVRLMPGYLYSLPGQGGSFRLEDSSQLETLLTQAGIQPDVKRPLATALSDMNFDAIKIELDTTEDGDATLRLGLKGKSNAKEWPAPIDLNVNLHGSLETVLNTGLKLSQ